MLTKTQRPIQTIVLSAYPQAIHTLHYRAVLGNLPTRTGPLGTVATVYMKVTPADTHLFPFLIDATEVWLVYNVPPTSDPATPPTKEATCH